MVDGAGSRTLSAPSSSTWSTWAGSGRMSASRSRRGLPAWSLSLFLSRSECARARVLFLEERRPLSGQKPPQTFVCVCVCVRVYHAGRHELLDLVPVCTRTPRLSRRAQKIERVWSSVKKERRACRLRRCSCSSSSSGWCVCPRASCGARVRRGAARWSRCRPARRSVRPTVYLT